MIKVEEKTRFNVVCDLCGLCQHKVHYICSLDSYICPECLRKASDKLKDHFDMMDRRCDCGHVPQSAPREHTT